MKIQRSPQRGFTLVELAIATVVLIVGVISVLQLVPRVMDQNQRTRFDTTSVVIAQRLLDQMLGQSLNNVQFTDLDGNIILLGDPALSNQVVGAPVIVVNNQARINFNAPLLTAGYSFQYIDPNDPTQTTYDVRWAVITLAAGGTVSAKRFIVGAWRRDRRQITPPATVEGWVQR